MALSGPSVRDVMASSKGHTTGFDYLRIGLAVLVVISHATLLCVDKTDLIATPLGPFFDLVLPSFFALSGFLVSGSLVRNSVPKFIALRALRIFPALAVETTLCALILGPAFTVLPLAEYFASPMFHRYFLNIIGDIHYTLPGLFDGETINLQLRTIPAELECYISLVCISLVGLIRRRWLLLALLSLATLVLTWFSFVHGLVIAHHVMTLRVLVTSFLWGSLAFYFRDRVRMHSGLFVASIALSLLFFAIPQLTYLSGPTVAYATVYIGLQRFPPIPFGDLSYGVYLFHYPVGAMLIHVVDPTMHWFALFFWMMVVTTPFAALSWTLIEHPLLNRKNQVLAFLDRTIPHGIHARRIFNPSEAPITG
jgi:peptidoglycan/LPS O-acetylase OafA/YrhL